MPFFQCSGSRFTVHECFFTRILNCLSVVSGFLILAGSPLKRAGAITENMSLFLFILLLCSILTVGPPLLDVGFIVLNMLLSPKDEFVDMAFLAKFSMAEFIICLVFGHDNSLSNCCLCFFFLLLCQDCL